MQAPIVTIEPVIKQGQPFWQVSMGKRRLTFNNELAARTFAAQLHLRVKSLAAPAH
ncbi:hypothetical protein [Pseudomonas sp. 5P_3.1_Bac2]|uniref:hypothetical protein n=1 Tax=Pseudomonas sp. 5P_3.1_Bac2 TaxID=2971617 RepID=UPI0021CA1067|nr:hypothetical protein [Pseudomonas sp. 5P_3.1_Bac2]MCU1717130.1 hypothetical protein [Pseudomonas sp. 5P_3.1_Bac2]